MKNEVSKEVKESKHTKPIKNKEGKAVGHITTEKKEGKNFKAEHSKGHAKDGNCEIFEESYSYSEVFNDKD